MTNGQHTHPNANANANAILMFLTFFKSFVTTILVYIINVQYPI